MPGVSSENGVVYQVPFFVSFKMNPRIRSRDKSMLPESPRNRLPSSIDLHSRRAEGQPKYHRTPATGIPLEEYHGEKRKQKEKKKEKKTREMPVKRLLVSVEFILIISTFFLRRETHLPATEENSLSLSLSLSLFPPLFFISPLLLLLF